MLDIGSEDYSCFLDIWFYIAIEYFLKSFFISNKRYRYPLKCMQSHSCIWVSLWKLSRPNRDNNGDVLMVYYQWNEFDQCKMNYHPKQIFLSFYWNHMAVWLLRVCSEFELKQKTSFQKFTSLVLVFEFCSGHEQKDDIYERNIISIKCASNKLITIVFIHIKKADIRASEAL